MTRATKHTVTLNRQTYTIITTEPYKNIRNDWEVATELHHKPNHFIKIEAFKIYDKSVKTYAQEFKTSKTNNGAISCPEHYRENLQQQTPKRATKKFVQDQHKTHTTKEALETILNNTANYETKLELV